MVSLSVDDKTFYDKTLSVAAGEKICLNELKLCNSWKNNKFVPF